MSKKSAIAAFTFAIFLLSVDGASAQNRLRDKQCPQPVYASNEVTRRAQIIDGPDFSEVMEVFRNVNGRVRLDAVLCRSGEVTDINVTEGLSATVNEFVSDAVSIVRFVPAELSLHSVSQKIQFEFEINAGRVKEIIRQPAAGRLVESVNVIGNRRLGTTSILALVRTRAGEPYDEVRVKRDFDAILATRNFDKLSTRVFTEEGVRGGVGVYFEVHELPVVGVLSFEGLKIDPAIVREAWKAAHVNLQAGEPYSPEAGKMAIQVIKQVLDSRALNYSRVELRSELLTAQTVNLTFVITNQ